MSQDDDADDPDRTIVRPGTPPPRFLAAAPAAEPAAPELPVAAAERGSPVLPGANPLVAAARFLLGLASRLRDRAAPRDVEDLRSRVMAEIRSFEAAALAAGVPAEQIRAGRYAIAATIDDLVLSTAWGSQSLWTHRGMVSSLYNEAAGGERFFEILEQLERDPARNADVLELFYLCLGFGFEGKYRLLPQGAAELAQLRERLFRLLPHGRADEEARALAPHWRGVAALHRPLRPAVPLWVILAALAGLLTAVFWGFDFLLNRQSDETFAALQAIAPDGPIAIARAAPAAASPPDAAAPPQAAPEQPADGPYRRISTALKPEIDQGQVGVIDAPGRVIIRISGSGLFWSGSATVTAPFEPLIQRIAAALSPEPGAIVVAGNTDDIPIHNLRFPSNWHLSVARAQSVVDLLAPGLADPARLTAEGRADTDPIASNSTPEGREANRRIDIILDTPGPAAAPAAGATVGD